MMRLLTRSQVFGQNANVRDVAGFFFAAVITIFREDNTHQGLVIQMPSHWHFLALAPACFPNLHKYEECEMNPPDELILG